MDARSSTPSDPPPEGAEELPSVPSQELFAEREGPQLEPEDASDAPPPPPSSGPPPRYSIRRRVGSGGMGTIFKVFDSTLRRSLAMKVLRVVGDPRAKPAAHGGTRLQRFLEEAQVTGQLDHPNIVPVHDLGVDEQGRVFFTMRLVRGRDLGAILELLRAGKEGWNVTRALGVLLKVCEAMAFAHSRKVIHRDLKPSNVMVGAFGEVYVMDWGLARVEGRANTDELEATLTSLASVSQVVTDRAEERRRESDSPALTAEGSVIGTPYYMPPEQAAGRVGELTYRGDVYSVGAMLYEVLAGRMPYQIPGERASHQAILARVLLGAPVPLRSIVRSVPAELEAICEKAMAREPERRYADMGELAADLRAYLENRVVRAHAVGALAELRKWTRRNRLLAAAIVLVAAGVVGGLAWSRTVAVAARRSIDETSDLYRCDWLAATAEELWPIGEPLVPRIEEWLAVAATLRDHLPMHAARVAAGDAAVDAAVDAGARIELANSREIVASCERLFGREGDGGLERRLRERLDASRQLAARSISGADVARRWEQAIASIADPAQCPAYAGLRIRPQLGLVPIRKDADTGLWEFLHVVTGSAPSIGADGSLVLEESGGIVLVLIPGGRFTLGADLKRDPGAVERFEGPPHEVELAPFFLSKYEMTQGQWLRVEGRNPSLYFPGCDFLGEKFDLLHPVENVFWEYADRVVRKLGLALPTEAQWEYAARAGTTTPYWSGATADTLAGCANVCDRTAHDKGAPKSFEGIQEIDDGHVVHSRVGSFRRNPWGLHDVTGNVVEWCRELYAPYRGTTVRTGDGERIVSTTSNEKLHVFRGGGFYHGAENLRVAYRFPGPGFLHAYGLRPSRPLDP